MRNKERGYILVSLPRTLIKEIGKLIGEYSYTSRAEIIKEALRRYLNEKKMSQYGLTEHH
ncbi:MAG: ribbon-helix-helix domain-containing protein [Candidatus Bathyarchaeia archaeon]